LTVIEKKMSAKNNLEKKYASARRWRQVTESYGFWVYPHSYYSELVDIVLQNK
tara:strand:+ start:239 stop:397 length:159 start_codon:yes stop_codon:yes gene_type:complete